MTLNPVGYATFTVPLDHPNLAGFIALLGQSAPVQPPAPVAAPLAFPSGCSVDATGLVVLDANGAAIVANPRDASPRTLEVLRLLATDPNVTEADILTIMNSGSLIGFKAAMTKRVQTAFGGKKLHPGAGLFRVEGGKVVVRPETRAALAAFFGIQPAT